MRKRRTPQIFPTYGLATSGVHCAPPPPPSEGLHTYVFTQGSHATLKALLTLAHVWVRPRRVLIAVMLWIRFSVALIDRGSGPGYGSLGAATFDLRWSQGHGAV